MQNFLEDQNVVPRQPKKATRSKDIKSAVTSFGGRIMLVAALATGVGGLVHRQNEQSTLHKEKQLEALEARDQFEQTYRNISPAVAGRIIANFHAHDQALIHIPVAKAAIEAGSDGGGVDPDEARQLEEDGKAAKERVRTLEAVVERTAQDAQLYLQRQELWQSLCKKHGVTNSQHPQISAVIQEFTRTVASQQPTASPEGTKTASEPSTAKD